MTTSRTALVDAEFARVLRRCRLDRALDRWAADEPALAGLTAAEATTVAGEQADQL
jgi:hypothetical protein